MSKRYDIFTAMDICADFLVDIGTAVPEFGQKEKLVRDYNIELGGSCCIFACQTAKLGLRTIGAGKAGDDGFGRMIISKLRDAQVDTGRIIVGRSTKTGVGIALCRDDGDRATLTYNGTIDALEESDIPLDIVRTSHHIHVGSYYLMKKLQPAYPDILRKAKEAGATISLDTNWDPDELWDIGKAGILPYVDILLLNENEIKATTKTDSIEKAIYELAGIVPFIVVKKGKEGAQAFAAGRNYSAPSYDAVVADTVGAGDCFDGGFIYGYLAGYDIAKCLKAGCICGSSSTKKPGGIAGQIYLEELEAVIDNDL
ncbi:MAG: carbohydrate kinase family protein [Saccharofermentanales bacterium]